MERAETSEDIVRRHVWVQKLPLAITKPAKKAKHALDCNVTICQTDT